MKAIWKDTVLAESPQEDLIRIEGNWYFPPANVKQEFIKESDLSTTCFWKGKATYYDIEVDGEVNDGAAFYYHEPLAGSTEKVGKDFTDYVAFWRGVEVAE